MAGAAGAAVGPSSSNVPMQHADRIPTVAVPRRAAIGQTEARAHRCAIRTGVGMPVR